MKGQLWGQTCSGSRPCPFLAQRPGLRNPGGLLQLVPFHQQVLSPVHAPDWAPSIREAQWLVCEAQDKEEKGQSVDSGSCAV